MRLISKVLLAAGLAMAGASAPGLAQSSDSNAGKAASSKAAKKPAAAKAPARAAPKRQQAVRAPLRPSEGQLAGLHGTADVLALRSSVALVVDQDTNEVLFEKNPHAVLPIASITKLMTALVTLEAGLPLEEDLLVTPDELVKAGVRSRIAPGTRLSRDTALHLALMSSENRAAQLLGRTYPGGLPNFVAAMNTKAQLLGMDDSHFVDPTGLSSDNKSSPADLVRLVKAAYEHPKIREYSTSGELSLPMGRRMVQYGNTNGLTKSPDWDIGLQKTGYISAAGRCLVMSAVIEGQRVVMVLLDSIGKYSRIGDAQRIRTWLEARKAQAPHAPQAATQQATVGGAT